MNFEFLERDIDDNYTINIWGQVRNKTTNKFLKNILNGGYFKINIVCGGKRKCLSIHSLLASTFLNIKGRAIHINGIKTDNRLSNLTSYSTTVSVVI